MAAVGKDSSRSLTVAPTCVMPPTAWALRSRAYSSPLLTARTTATSHHQKALYAVLGMNKQRSAVQLVKNSKSIILNHKNGA
jgi:hypothetical protein